ncbi:hypothetical protein H4Q26_009248 [Puccinia striiformis f. sp. tritici PST-130]|nr:hypothetical protein H4Q26_009248 [Puccinia striiformis f. sp. tritici PST-130]
MTRYRDLDLSLKGVDKSTWSWWQFSTQLRVPAHLHCGKKRGGCLSGARMVAKLRSKEKPLSYSRRLQLVKGLKPKEAAIARRGVPVMTPALEKTKARTPRRNAGAVMHENNLQQAPTDFSSTDVVDEFPHSLKVAILAQNMLEFCFLLSPHPQKPSHPSLCPFSVVKGIP